MKEYIGVDLGGAYFKAGRVFEGSVRSEHQMQFIETVQNQNFLTVFFQY